MLYCVVLYCTVLHCAVLYCNVLHCTLLHCNIQFGLLYCSVLYYTELYYSVVHNTVLSCNILYCTILYCAALYFNVLYSLTSCAALRRIPLSFARGLSNRIMVKNSLLSYVSSLCLSIHARFYFHDSCLISCMEKFIILTSRSEEICLADLMTGLRRCQ